MRAADVPQSLGLLAMLGASACASLAAAPERPTPAAEGMATERAFLPAIELVDDPLEDAVVRVVGTVSCTGTLIADDLVLTAHHCVSARDAGGHVLKHDVEATSVKVELGGGDFPYGDVDVRAIVTPDCGYVQGEGDIAVLVLSRRLVGMPTYQLREAPPKPGDFLDTAGFGRCASSKKAIHRERRTRDAFIQETREGDFLADANICPGDSGGPALDRERRVLGVVSSSVMDTVDSTSGRSYFVRVDRWLHLLSTARAVADGSTLAELPPFRDCRLRPP